MRFFDHPRYVKPAVYESAIDRVVEALTGSNQIHAVYQVGSMAAPGISDIDLLVVFNDLPPERVEPFVDLNEDERYLFAHDLFGIPESGFRQLRRFTMYHNYRLLWGVEPESDPPELNVDEAKVLKEQIAFEFLLSNYIARTIDLSYGLASIRGLLLSGHALRYDLEFLGITSGPLLETVAQLNSWRKNWFESGHDSGLTTNWLIHLRSTIHDLLNELMPGGAMYLPCDSSAKLARHISLERADTLGVDRKGVSMPLLPGLLGKRAKKVMSRFNHFRFKVPYRSEPRHSILDERFDFLARMITLKTAGFMAFDVPTSNLVNMVLRNMERPATVARPIIRNRQGEARSSGVMPVASQTSKGTHP